MEGGRGRKATANKDKKLRVFALCLVKMYNEVMIKVVGLLCG